MKTSLKQRLLALLMSALLLVSFCGAAALAEAEIPSPGVGDEDCTHPEELREEAVKVVDYLYKPIEGDAAQHMTTEIEEVTVVCGECFAPLEEASTRQGKSYAEDHVEGEGTVVEVVESVCAPMDGDALNHAVMEVLSVSAQCAECGAAMGEPAEETRQIATEPHNYKAVNGKYVCADCGLECPHEHTEEVEYSNPDYDDYYHVDDETHTSVELVHTAIICQDCGGTVEVLPEVEEVLGEPEPHTFEYNGMYCDVCDYPKGGYVECDHVAPDVDDPENWDVYEDYFFLDKDNHTHYKKYTYLPICEECGEWIPFMVERTEVESEAEPHEYDENGMCACGWYKDGGFAPEGSDCRHANISTDFYDYSWGIGTYCKQRDAERHLYIGAEIRVDLFCEDCQEHLGGYSYFDPDFTWLSAHEFSEDAENTMVCVDCGYTTTCAHENMTWVEQQIENVSTPIDTGNGTHVSLVSGYVWYECPDCGADRWEDYNFEMREAPHEDHDLDGFCDDCGAETGACIHENFTVVGWSQTYDYAWLVDEVLHNIRTVYAPVIRCADCGEEFVDRYNEYAADYKYEEIYEMHTYDAGNMCTVCGYTTDCTHKNADIKRTPSDVWYTSNDDGMHQVHTDTRILIDCPDCDRTMESYEYASEEEAHAYDEDFYCPDCGHYCEHSGATTEVTFEATGYDDAAATDKAHVVTGVEITTTTCPHCGKVEKAEAEKTAKEAHAYEVGEDGTAVCAECDYACTHASSTVREVFVVDAYTSNGASGHTVKGDTHLVERCDGCGAVFTDVVRTEGVSYDEPHTLRDGKCALCGYVKPVKKSSEPAAEPAAAITFVEVDALHGAIVAEAPRMAVALVNVANALETENGEALDLAVEGLDELLAAEEIEALKALPAAEQMLVTLKALGYADEADFAIAELQLTLSPEALALIDAIEARVAALTEDERAAYDAQLAKLFPIVQDAEGVNRTELTLEVRLDGEADYRLEKYTFAQQADMTWALDAIAFAEVQG